MSLIKVLGSLKFAIGLIAALIVLLTVSTFMESAHGTPFAQKVFYTARWFDILLALVWVNIFCATLTRWPFKKHHVGFVVTHIGILLVLLGALLSRIYGVEGQMTLFEGEGKTTMIRSGHTLRLSLPDGSEIRKALAPGKSTLIPLSGGAKIVVNELVEHALLSQVLEEGGPADPLNHAVQATLSSQTVGLNETFVLIENDPSEPDSDSKMIGPARVELKTPASELPKLRIRRKSDGRLFSIPLKDAMPASFSLEDSGLMISNLRYYPNAKVEGKQLLNMPAAVRFNPAVEFEISNSKGRRERHTRFFLFPDFGSLRGGESNDVFRLAVDLDVPVPHEIENQPKTASLTFRVSEKNEWICEIRSSKSETFREIPLHLNEKIPTGWMDITLEARRVFNRVKIKTKVKKDEKKASEAAAIFGTIEEPASPAKPFEVFIGEPAVIETSQGRVRAALESNTAKLPFGLALKDFRKKDYPGTANAASYESDVALVDDAENLRMEKTIRMNKPLDYKGYRVFQSSFIQDESFGEASVFTIAKNPGIRFIYGGSVILFLGVILLFYFHPFFTGK